MRNTPSVPSKAAASAFGSSTSATAISAPRSLHCAASSHCPLLSSIADSLRHRRWHDATTVAEELGCNLFLEIPPGHILTDLAKENNPGVTASVVTLDLFRYLVRLAVA